MREIRFNLDSSIELAQEFSINKIEGHNLIIVPERPTWLVLSDEEFSLFKELVAGTTLRTILNKHQDKVVYSVLSKIEQAHFYITDISTETDPTPELNLYLTHRCNLKCVHCYDDAGTKFDDELSTEQWLDIIDQYSSFVSNGGVTLTGGEPTLYPDLLTILKRIKSQGHETVLFSNGTTNGGRFGWEKVCSYLDYVQFSIDGFSPEVHDAIRGHGAFAKVLDGFKTVYQLNVPLRISVCLMPQNIDSIASNLKDFLLEHDPDKRVGVILSPTVTRGRNLGNYSLAFREVFDKLANVLTEIWNLGWTLPRLFKKNQRRTRCGIGTQITISSQGKLRPCVFSQSTGHIFEEKLVDWHNRMRDKYSNLSVDHIPQCERCDLRYICSGGCALLFEHRKRCSSKDDATSSRIKRYFLERLIHEALLS